MGIDTGGTNYEKWKQESGDPAEILSVSILRIG
jgi:hypothetical protein